VPSSNAAPRSSADPRWKARSKQSDPERKRLTPPLPLSLSTALADPDGSSKIVDRCPRYGAYNDPLSRTPTAFPPNRAAVPKPASSAATAYGRWRGHTSSPRASDLTCSRSGVSTSTQYCQAPASSLANLVPARPARKRRASPPSSRHDASQASTSARDDGSVQPRSPSATLPPASITNPSVPPPVIECTRPELRPPARIDAELNRAPSDRAATACPASCHAVATASRRAGTYVSAYPPW
jgi:hypothetical protein